MCTASEILDVDSVIYFTPSSVFKVSFALNIYNLIKFMETNILSILVKINVTKLRKYLNGNKIKCYNHFEYSSK